MRSSALWLAAAGAALFPAPLSAQTCDSAYDVGGGQPYATIQAAVDAVPAALVDNPCVVLKDAATFNEQVTVAGKTNNGFVLTIMKDTGLGSNPVIDPPAGSTAAFQIANASVSIVGLNVIPTNPIPYGVNVSSEYVRITSMTVDGGGGTVTSAGVVATSSWLTFSNSSVSVATNAAFFLTGGGNNNTISQSTLFNSNGRALQLSAAHYTTVDQSSLRSTGNLQWGLLSLSGTHNLFTRSFISAAQGDAVNMDGGSFYNTISFSTITTQAGNEDAVIFYGASSNTVTDSYLEASTGVGLRLRNVAHDNTVLRSTVIAGSIGIYMTEDAAANAVEQSVVRCAFAGCLSVSLDTNGGGNVIRQNTLTGGLLSRAISIQGSDRVAVLGNNLSGDAIGIYASGATRLAISSNTVVIPLNAVVANSVNYGMFLTGSGHTIWNNSFVYRDSFTMGTGTSYAIYLTLASDILVARNRVSNPGQITGGSFRAVFLDNADNVDFQSNDILGIGTGLTNASLMQVVNGSTNVAVASNIFSSSFAVTGASSTLQVDAGSQTGFVSDYNDLYSQNALTAFVWGANAYGNLAAWQAGSAQDANSISGDPLWFDVSAGVEDFHPKSTAGRYQPGSGTFVSDASASPTIDAGDPAAEFGFEPAPNGSRVNLGSYGNTAEASKSAQSADVTGYGVFYSSITAILGPLSPNPPSYRMEASTASDFSGNLASATAGGSATSISVGGLGLSTTYFFRVGTLTGGATNYLATVTTVTLAASPAPLSFTGITGAQFTVNWSTNGNPSGTRYSVEVSTAIAFGVLTSSISSTGTGATFALLAQNTTFFVRVVAYNLAGSPSDPALGAVITAPGVITISANRLAGVWYNNDLAVFNAQGAVTYHYSLTAGPSDIPSLTDPVFDGSALPVTLSGSSLYFHVLGLDGSANAVGTAHFGPLQSDTGTPAVTALAAQKSASDPTPIADGGATLFRVPRFTWSATSTSPVIGYSYSLSLDPAQQPDQAVDITIPFIDASLSQSGVHYFKVRPLNLAGSWGPSVGMSFGFTNTPSVDNVLLKGNYLNPTRGDCAAVEVQTAAAGRVRIELYTLLGEKVGSWADADVGPGTYSYSWCGRNDAGRMVSSGAYLLHVQAPQHKKTYKVVVAK